MTVAMTTRASFADVPEIRALLADAYYDDPLTEWIFADVATRRDACAAWYGLFVEQYVSGAQATVIRDDDAIGAVALWRLASDAPLSSAGVPGIAGLLTALVGAERAGTIADGLHRVGSVQEQEPRAYLNFLAVAADRRRAGLGRRVLEPVFAAAADAGLPVALETTNPANYAFYEALGFAETARIQIGSDGPLLRALRLG
jgi:ribosomal protein S18 acetylase RimI-like enzyme